MQQQVTQLVAVAPFVVIPGDQLHEVAGQSDTSFGIEDRGAGIAGEVGGNNRIFGVAHDALQFAFAGFFHRRADFIIGNILGQTAGQVYHGNVQGRNTHGHTGQLAVCLLYTSRCVEETGIAKAVLYGRTIFKSIRKFIVFQLTMNLCAVGVSILGPVVGVDTPVTVVQMLWINMIMDTLGGLAFARCV